VVVLEVVVAEMIPQVKLQVVLEPLVKDMQVGVQLVMEQLGEAVVAQEVSEYLDQHQGESLVTVVLDFVQQFLEQDHFMLVVAVVAPTKLQVLQRLAVLVEAATLVLTKLLQADQALLILVVAVEVLDLIMVVLFQMVGQVVLA
jgi:hypothetical protein